jgi:hypothetical protein
VPAQIYQIIDLLHSGIEANITYPREALTRLVYYMSILYLNVSQLKTKLIIDNR